MVSPPPDRALRDPHAGASAREALRQRLEALGRQIGAREASDRDALAAARSRAEALHAVVADGLDAFHAALDAQGAPHLRVELGVPRLDDKHVRAVQFDLRRGRHAAIVTVKNRGQVTLVGPFRQGKVEGPCKSFPFEAEAEIESALGEFLERFLAEAASP